MNEKEIFVLELNEIKKLVNSNEISVCVIGIGRIGLPTALSFANSALQTIGVDINENLIDKINRKEIP